STAMVLKRTAWPRGSNTASSTTSCTTSFCGARAQGACAATTAHRCAVSEISPASAQSGHSTGSADLLRARVLILGPTAPPSGGMVTVVQSFRGSSLSEQFQIVILNTAKTTPEDRWWWTGVWAQVRLCARILALLLRGDGEIVHIHTCSGLTFWRDCLFLLLARLCRSKVVWHVHGARFDEFVESTTGIMRAMLSRAFAMSDLVIVLGEHWRRKLGRVVPAPAWAVVENGVPLPPAKARLKTKALLFAGNLDGRKGEEDLIVATAIAAR